MTGVSTLCRIPVESFSRTVSCQISQMCTVLGKSCDSNFVCLSIFCVNKSRQRENYRETTKPEVHESGSSGTMRLCVETIVTLLTAVLVSSASVPDSDDGQSVTVGASWLQRRSNVVEEVVHSLDDYDEPTTSTATTSNSTNAHNVSMRR